MHTKIKKTMLSTAYLVTFEVTVSYGQVAHVGAPLVEVHSTATASLVVKEPAATNTQSQKVSA
jgi:hypothetical protein